MAKSAIKDVSTPCDTYLEMRGLWIKCAAVCAGEEAVKAHDTISTLHDVDNFLIPFSPTMLPDQYRFLRREAELPGVSSEFAGLLVGALLRKEPEVVLPDRVPAGAVDWIKAEFGADGSPLVTYMDTILWDEVTTSRSWTFVDLLKGIPTPIKYDAEDIINWKKNDTELTMVVVRRTVAVRGESEFHDDQEERYRVHELVDGRYQVRNFIEDANGDWKQDGKTSIPLMFGKPLDYIPGWPNNGEIEPEQPFLLNLVNKEIALYNKITRRNHLLYNAATYTPYISGPCDDEEFKKIVGAGLGSWLNIPENCKLDTLKVPTEALVDLDRSIADGFEEMAKLGARMMSPETSQSGVALQLRNASQTARIGTLNTRVSVIMCQIIATMINWRYNLDLKPADVKFNLQSDFTIKGQGETWLRLATEWYESKLIPRSIWLQMLNNNDMLPDDYNDKDAVKELKDEEYNPFETFEDEIDKGVPKDKQKDKDDEAN